ncbi:MAG: hypothetical protein ABSG25_14005 [Bryobacteraceae bacterium]
MIYIQAVKKRAILRQIIEGAVAANMKASEALLAFQQGLYGPSFKQGKVVINTSGNGQSASFAIGLTGAEYTQDAVFGLSEEFFDILDDSLANAPAPGLTDDGTEANTRAIFAAMKADDRLQSVNRRGTDFTLLGFPQTGQLTGI